MKLLSLKAETFKEIVSDIQTSVFLSLSIFCVIPNLFTFTDHPLQGFISHCSVRGYSSLLVSTAEAEATTRTGRQHTHVHAHTHTTNNSTLYYLQT